MTKPVQKYSKKFSDLINSGYQDMQAKEYKSAIKKFRAALKTKPKDLIARLNLGAALANSGDLTTASEIIHRLHEDFPDHVDTLRLSAQIYTQLNQFDIAIKFLKRIINQNNNDLEAWLSLAAVASSNMNHTEALAYSTRALELSPTDSRAHLNLGAALLNLNKLKEALYCFETVLTLDPGSITALSNAAVILERLGDYDGAVALVDECLSRTQPGTPQHSDLLYRKSYSLLCVGKLKEGWECYEHGFIPKNRMARTPQRYFRVPKWDGGETTDKTLLIWREQGIGDEIMFASAIPDAIARCSKVIIETEPRLVTLFQRSFPNVLVRPQSYRPLDKSSSHDDFDVQISVGSLMSVLRNSVEDFGRSAAYLVPDSKLVESFSERLNNVEGKVLGICWRSGFLANDRNEEYTSISDWGPIFALDGYTFVNLQYGDCERELQMAEEHFGIKILRWSDVDLKDDQESVAALIKSLDFVVSAGTAVAQLAAAVGTKTLLFGKRGWPNLGTERYPWHPSCEFFELIPGEPTSNVIPKIAHRLSKEKSAGR